MSDALKSKLLVASAVRVGVVKLEGEEVLVREIGTLEFAAYGALAKTDKLRATALLVAACVVDAEGAALFSESEALEIAATARIAMPLVTKVMELSGFGEEDEKHADAS